jgi:ribosomal protein L11 methyltransferase
VPAVAPVSWYEVRVRLEGADVDELAGMIAGEIATAGVEVRADSVAFWVGEAETDAALANCRALVARLGGSADVSVTPAAPEREWREAYKRYFRAARLTRQVIVAPSWDPAAPSGDDVVIELDPGMAFGTGSHATTQLVLEAIQDLADTGLSPARILDLGTGSGILALAAARLFPAAALEAIDNDPLAVEAAAENTAHNDLADRVAVSATPLAELAPGFDLILANIQRPVLLELADPLTAAAATGATVVLAGLLLPELDEIEAAYLERSWAEPRRLTRSETDWGALMLRRPAIAPGSSSTSTQEL